MDDLYEAEDADIEERGHFEEDAEDPDDKPIKDDEEIDEDEAFNEEDYETYGTLEFSRKHRPEKGKGRKGKAVRAEPESSEEEDEGGTFEEGGAMWPNLDALDSAGDTEAAEPKADDESKEDLGSSEEDEALNPEQESRLLALVAGGASSKPKKKRAAEQDESRAEDEFAIGPRGGEKLSVADLVVPVSGETAFGSLKRHVESLQRIPALHTPLPEVVAERELRKVGYEKSAAAISKFQPMVIAARRAEQLVFPLNAPSMLSASTTSIAQSVEPEKDWEKDVAAMLEKEGLDGAKGADELPDNNALTPEAAAARRAQLAKMKNRLFYAELKAKRQAKIKSKTYHKIQKRDKLRRAAEESAALAEADPEAAKEAGMKVERERIRERMQLRHRNTSLWARNLLSKGVKLNPANRAALAEANRISQELRRKMVSVNTNEEGEGDKGEGMEANVDTMEGTGEATAPAVEKGLFGMKFMQRAVAKQAEAARRREAGEDGYDIDESKGKGESGPMRRRTFAGPAEDNDLARNSSGSTGRVRFVEGTHQVQRAASEAGRVTKTKGPLRLETQEAEAEGDGIQHTDEDLVENGAPEKDSGAKRKPNGTAAAQKAAKKAARNKAASEPLDKASDFVAVSANPWLAVSAEAAESAAESSSVATAPKPAATSSVVAPAGGFHLLGQKTEEQRSAQAELVARAFATADLEKEFEDAKAQEAEEETPTKKPEAALPGWGGWAGEGIKAPKNPRVPNSKEPATAAPPRKDKHLKSVVISERRDAKLAKFMAADVPQGFADAVQYEKTLRMPLGPEWHTSAVHRRMTAPKVVVHSGTAIEPMKYSKRQHDAIQAPKLKKQQRKVPKNLLPNNTK